MSNLFLLWLDLDQKAKPKQMNSRNHSCFSEQFFNDPGFFFCADCL